MKDALLLRPRRRGPACELPADVRRVPPRVRALRAHLPRRRGRLGRDGRLREPRVHGRRRSRRGRLRLVPELRLRGQRGSGAAAPRPGSTARAARERAADGRGAHPRRLRHRGRRRAHGRRSRGAVEVDRLRRRRRARASRSSPATGRSTSTRSRRRCGPKKVRLFGDDDFAAQPELPKGYIGPHFGDASVVVADPARAGRDRVGHRRESRRPSRRAMPCSGATSTSTSGPTS